MVVALHLLAIFHSLQFSSVVHSPLICIRIPIRSALFFLLLSFFSAFCPMVLPCAHTNTRSYINMKIKCIRNSLPHTKRATFLLLSNGNVFVSSCAQIQCDRVQSRLKKNQSSQLDFGVCVRVCARTFLVSNWFFMLMPSEWQCAVRSLKATIW